MWQVVVPSFSLVSLRLAAGLRSRPVRLNPPPLPGRRGNQACGRDPPGCAGAMYYICALACADNVLTCADNQQPADCDGVASPFAVCVGPLGNPAQSTAGGFAACAACVWASTTHLATAPPPAPHPPRDADDDQPPPHPHVPRPSVYVRLRDVYAGVRVGRVFRARGGGGRAGHPSQSSGPGGGKLVILLRAAAAAIVVRACQ